MSLHFFARGLPKAQPRPRSFAIRGKNGKPTARVHDAGTAEGWKSAVVAAGACMRPSAPLSGPVEVRFHFMMPRPKRLMRKKDPDGLVPHTAKPDADNLAKAVLDAMTADGWWRDDSQVYRFSAVKHYASKDGCSGVVVDVHAEDGN